MVDSTESSLGRIAYEARFATWPKEAVVDFDRLSAEYKAVWEGVADAISAPQVAALHNALEQMAFAAAALNGAGEVRTGLIAQINKLRQGLVIALAAMESHEVFVTSKEKVEYPEGVAEWARAISEIREALHPPTSEEVAAV